MNRIALFLLMLLCGPAGFGATFQSEILPLLKSHCLVCHSSADREGELDLERFSTMDLIRREPAVWQEVLRQITENEMPPKEEQQFTPDQRASFLGWLRATLDEIALSQAGDPGPVLLRRLSNHEYTYTLRDLTNIPGLDPAQEFPADGAAGEGFTNVGSALVMSPGLLTKYLDAAKEVASHAVILPERLSFSPSTFRADWTQEKLNAIRNLYATYAVPGRATDRNLQGVQFSTTDAGTIPIARYLQAIDNGDASGLSPKYLALLTAALEEETPSLLLNPIRSMWNGRKSNDLTAIAAHIGRWQQALWHFGKVGHIGKRDGPQAWQMPVMPIASSQTVRLQLPESDKEASTVYLVAGDAGDGNQGDVVVWRDAWLEFPDRPRLALKHVEPLVDQVREMQKAELARTGEYLAVVETAFRKDGSPEKQTTEQQTTEQSKIQQLAIASKLNPDLAVAWAEFVQLNPVAPRPSGYLMEKKTNVGGYASIRGWGEGLPALLANQSEDDLAFSTLRVPGRGVTIHPTPEIAAAVYWQSPITTTVSLEGFVADMDNVCGNGAAWTVQLIAGDGVRELAADHFANGGRQEFGPIEDVSVRKGDLIKLTVSAHENNHACDTTQVAFKIAESRENGLSWDLSDQIVDRIHEGNPLSDSHGNPDVWHFCRSEAEASRLLVPVESSLARWRSAVLRGQTADAGLVQNGVLDPTTPADRELAVLCHRLRGGLNWMELHRSSESKQNPGSENRASADPDSADIKQQAPSVWEFRLPNDLVAGATLVATVALDPERGVNGSVQAYASLEPPKQPLELSPGRLVPAAESRGTLWSDGETPVVSDRPILVGKDSEAEKRILQDITEFQSLFPAALCYDRIVPVDEVVTLTLRYREDEHLQRLMLDSVQNAQLDQLWDELYFVSRQPFQQLDAYKQLWQFATQDADPSAFEPMGDPIQRAAESFKKRLVTLEPLQLEMVLDFAKQAWRRPLTEQEKTELRDLYHLLRDQPLQHEPAIRQLIARILIAPTFLYRGEAPAEGVASSPVNDWELATRLSYFLWSTAPDQDLRAAADAGKLGEPEVLRRQIRRMLADDRIRRLATEFGCQWLLVRDLETLEEKSERHFPSFANLRSDMQEEITRFWIDLFQEDGSLLSLLDADHTFLNSSLAKHYGIDLKSDHWQRVTGMRARGRGGVLGFAGSLSKQSGASRTSPILRGNWINEVLLGERLPRPPKDVPVLPDEAPGGLTERELIERHSQVAECARCHDRIDPFGFALEGFDAIGRTRSGIDTHARLRDGTTFDGIEGLRDYLLNSRREDFLRQICRKLLGYALGRSIQLSDKPLLDDMIEELNHHQQSVGVAIEMIVLSPQFRNVRGKDFLENH